MRRLPLGCDKCKEPFRTLKDLRTLQVAEGKVFVCRDCFLHLDEKDRRYRQRKAELFNKVADRQLLYPF